ncbi:MAG: imidazole glycerol phosphate synthase subunit HisH [Bacteroidales bacterium]|nr:imidazole glycerol phosphate synthase subunit HisH [Bacteroidales bacterium]
MNIAIIKYNAGNIQSVIFALQRLGIEAVLTDSAEEIRSADKVIFPGVGEASTTMEYLKKTKLDEIIVSLKQPVLGICLGMQLLCKYSEENETKCLGIFDNKIKLFPPKQKVPHVGWNNIYNLKSPLFKGLAEKSFVYFVHSFYAELNENSIADCEYILPFGAALHKNNFYAVQFHPEKSSKEGSLILKNFIELC